MRLKDHTDFTTLQWVKPELDETLSAARESLESYVDNPSDRTTMHTCMEYLHQVYGTLQMVELYGAAVVTAEMEALAAALSEDRITHREEAYAALMRGLMQLPDYLERLTSGHRDVPVVLLPLLNDLRASRAEPALDESAMFHPNLDAFLPEGVPLALSEADALARRGELVDLRLRFQQQLLGWFRGQHVGQQLAAMRKTLSSIAAHGYHVHGRRLWWIAAGVLEGLEQGMLESHASEVRQLIGKVDRSIRQLIEQGEGGLRGGDADDVARKLLYIVAQSSQRSPQMEMLRQTYALNDLLPDAAELEHARGSMSGHNRALLDSVSRALKDDLLHVKEALDLFMRQEGGNPSSLAAQEHVLERVGDTLGMLALNVPRRVIDEQRGVLHEIVNHVRKPDEETLLDVASALLYVESSLDDHIESLGSEEAPAPGPTDSSPKLPHAEARGIVVTLMQEAIANTSNAKQAVIAFVESGWAHNHLAVVPALMSDVAGALRMLSSSRPADLAEGISRFVAYELLEDRRIPSSVQMDHLADGVAALEYYLEAAREHRGGLDHILDVAEHSLGQLGYWPLPPERALARSPVAAPAVSQAESAPAQLEEHPELSESVSVLPGEDLAHLLVGQSEPLAAPTHDVGGLRLTETEANASVLAAEPDPTDDDGDWVEEEVFEQVPSPDALAANTGFNVNAEGIDDDIRDIFLEEVQEEIDSLQHGEQVWLADPSQLQSLIAIRRSFHTLKGSGRLVGASVLGEFAWKVEDMLNRVLDKTIQPHDGVQALVRHAIGALPELLAALKDEGVPSAPLSAIMRTAEELAAGQHTHVEDHIQTATMTVRRVVRHRVSHVEHLAQAIPPADITDAGSAMAAAAVEGEAVHPVSEPALDTPVMPPVDPVLLEILRSEVIQYLQTIRSAILHCEGELFIDEGLLRAVHTLHGAIAMVDIPLLTQLLSPLEGLFKRLRAAGLPLAPEGVHLLGESADLVDHVMGQFDVAAPSLPNADALTAQVIAMRDRYPESQVAHVVFETHPTDDEHEARAVEAVHGDEEPAAVHLDAHAEGLPETHEEASSEPIAESEFVAVQSPESPAEEDDLHHAAVAADLVAALGAFQPETSSAVPAATPEHTDSVHLDMAPLATTQSAQVAVDEVQPEPEVAAPRLNTPETSDNQVVDEPTTWVPVEHAPVDAAGGHASTRKEQEWAHPREAAGYIDADLLEVFLEEARELLDHLDGVLAQWHAEPAKLESVTEIQRDLHTLKGGARIAGLMGIGDLVHAMETLLEKPMHEVDSAGALITTLEASLDQLHALVQQVAQGRVVEYPQVMIDRLLGQAGEATFADDNVLAAAFMPPEQPVPTPVATPFAAHREGTAVQGLPELLPEQEEEASTQQEQIRVRADLLDSLVNHAGEVAIYRSRLEQQVAGYRFNLVELEQTVARLRSQLRMLEIETEAQIIARFQREHREAGLTVFDPLELDRYSQLQQYSRALAESVSDLVSIQSTLDELTRQAETLLIQQSRVSTELQDGLLRTRMLPFDTMVPNLRRTLRQAAQDQGKSAQLVVDGAHGEMDRNLLDRIKAPFEHMLRNAIAHGIEDPAERRRVGKLEEGLVNIRVAREATEVVIRVSDDGRGLDREAIRARGIERGLLRADVQPTDSQLLSLITQTGFSTASQVTQIAGRGVGMDVVANEIKQLGGSLSIESERGKGTTFVLRLPFTLAVTQAILVRSGDATFAIPMTSVQGVARISPDELASRLREDEPSFRYNNEEYGIHDLAELLGLPAGVPADEEQPPLLLTRAGDLRAAIRIDEVFGSREIVVKSVGPQISSVPGLLGATIMGDGSVLVILDLAPLVRHGAARHEQRLAQGLSAVQTPVIEEVRVRPLVMVVDDSITMRKVTGRVLERHEYEVGTAKDGVDALEKLHERVPDLMLLDIEMPRMDGYELATAMKADPRLRHVPIIMITSRSGDKHRQRALDIGVDRYLGKPYQEADLLAQISEVLEQRTGVES